MREHCLNCGRGKLYTTWIKRTDSAKAKGSGTFYRQKWEVIGHYCSLCGELFVSEDRQQFIDMKRMLAGLEPKYHKENLQR